jgi:hypothetical protein
MKGLVVHCKREKFDVYIGRPSKWGNPYTHIKNASTVALYEADTREDAIAYFERDLLSKPDLIEAAQNELRGKVLGCFCSPQACHGDVLAKFAETKTLYRLVPPDEYRLIETSGEFPAIQSLFYTAPITPSDNDRLLRLYTNLDIILANDEGTWIEEPEGMSEFNSHIVGPIMEVKP